MIKDYLILGMSVLFRPFLSLFLPKLKGNIIHIAYIKLGGLSKLINDLCAKNDYNLVTEVKGFLILYVRGVPFLLGRPSCEKLNYYLGSIDCLYHVHQLSWRLQDEWEFLHDKKYIVSIHDYYWICERFFMLDTQFNFCHNDGRCCTASTDRRKIMSMILLCARYIIIPDESMLKFLPEHRKYMVISHGI
jgi:hypothetical protein